MLRKLLAGAGLAPDKDDPEDGPMDRGGRSAFASIRAARDEMRAALLDDICRFLLDNDLDLVEENFAAALGVCTGNDVSLVQLVAQRRAQGLPVSQAWLGQQRQDKVGEFDRIGDALDRSLETFARCSRDARSDAARYSHEMSDHVSRAAEAQEREEIRNLTRLAMAMLERTRQLEDDMRRSEDEARSLRASLTKARRDAEYDHLTGLPNRRAFEGLFERQYREAQLALEPLSIAFCDIDHFKRINDSHGHDTGDRVLQSIASTLSRISGDNCHVARHGGEEFVMLFRGLCKQDAWQKLDDVREAFARRHFVNRRTDLPIGQITFSGGVADVFAYPSSRDALKAADTALYAAKAQGRNRILAAD